MASNYKITFKKNPSSTGLMGIGEGTPPTDIKYRGQLIGTIDFNEHWSSHVKGIRIRLMKKKDSVETSFNPKCPWEWVTLKTRPANEAEARQFCQDMKDQILSMVYLDKK